MFEGNYSYIRFLRDFFIRITLIREKIRKLNDLDKHSLSLNQTFEINFLYLIYYSLLKSRYGKFINTRSKLIVLMNIHSAAANFHIPHKSVYIP